MRKYGKYMMAVSAVVFASFAQAQINCVTSSVNFNPNPVIQYQCYDLNPPNSVQFNPGLVGVTGQFTHYSIQEFHDSQVNWSPLSVVFTSVDPANAPCAGCTVPSVNVVAGNQGSGTHTTAGQVGPFISTVQVNGSLTTTDTCNFGPCYFEIDITLTP